MTAKRPADPTATEAQGSVKEAIGKLLGDDDARRRGASEKTAAAKQSPTGKPPRR